jgi:trehalose utilization protein
METIRVTDWNEFVHEQTNAVHRAQPQGVKAGVPRHVPVEEAREKFVPRGPQLHNRSGKFT